MEHPYSLGDYLIQIEVGCDAYSNVYKARRHADDLLVALKQIHDYQSAFHEIEALQTQQHSPNFVLHEYFWSEDEDDVFYLPTDMSSVIRTKKKEQEGLSIDEIKVDCSDFNLLLAVDTCHRSSIIHRDFMW
ncbi:hypothetical protein L6452_30520 [Arctium lappa]|uniref:Uncharacterized protein n=1 Tax=Arctium lappa TaxID=4217 RepID=A0ACB8ZI33_ARCLA|nr:hypothetical protein L6452_30520 [Arctium lappa]